MRLQLKLGILALTVAIVILSIFFVSGSSQYCCINNVQVIAIRSATLEPGPTESSASQTTATFAFSIYNPGSITYIRSLTLWSTSLSSGPVNITSWVNEGNPTSSIIFSVNSSANTLASGKTTDFTYRPQTQTSVNIMSKQTYDYLFKFANGQWLNGSLTVQ
jgi:hypothetical protein